MDFKSLFSDPYLACLKRTSTPPPPPQFKYKYACNTSAEYHVKLPTHYIGAFTVTGTLAPACPPGHVLRSEHC